ncbi:hypothetical protein J3E69DRAFT_333025 [Trichoderma sp. SZMC 28015]
MLTSLCNIILVVTFLSDGGESAFCPSSPRESRSETSASRPSSYTWAEDRFDGASSITGLTVVCDVLFYIWKRHGQANPAEHNTIVYDKAQLHSNSFA